MISITFDKLEVAFRATSNTNRFFMLYYDGLQDFTQDGFKFHTPVPAGEWGCIWQVFDEKNGVDLGLLLCSYKRGGHTDLIHFKFDDALFYTTDFDFSAVYTKIGQMFELEKRGICSLDICYDTDSSTIFPGYKLTKSGYIEKRKTDNETGLSGLEFLHAFLDGKIKRESRFNRSSLHPHAEFHGKTAGGGEWDTFYIGMRGAVVFARHYNKTKEMEKNGEKTFITKRWEDLGWRGGEVWRFEVSFNKLTQKANQNLFLSTLEDYGSLNNAIQHIKNKFAGSFFYAALADFFNFKTVGERYSRWTEFSAKSTKLSHNCGYVIEIKRVRQPKQKKDLIQHNNITTYFSKYCRNIFNSPLAAHIFTQKEINRANWFISAYEQLHAVNLYNKNRPRQHIKGRFFRRRKPPKTDKVHIYNMHLTKLHNLH